MWNILVSPKRGKMGRIVPSGLQICESGSLYLKPRQLNSQIWAIVLEGNVVPLERQWHWQFFSAAV